MLMDDVREKMEIFSKYDLPIVEITDLTHEQTNQIINFKRANPDWTVIIYAPDGWKLDSHYKISFNLRAGTHTVLINDKISKKDPVPMYLCNNKGFTWRRM